MGRWAEVEAEAVDAVAETEAGAGTATVMEVARMEAAGKVAWRVG